MSMMPGAVLQRRPGPALAPAPGRGKYRRGRSARERREERRQRLLQAAVDVFGERGWAGSTVEAIVARAGMSRRTFYETFTDLEDVLLHVYDLAARELLAGVEARMAGVTDPVARLEAAVRFFLEALAEHAPLARVIFREMRAAGPQYEARHQRTLERFAALMTEGVREARALGVVSREPDEVTAYALVAGLEAVGMRYVHRREEARAVEAAPLLVELVYRAFR